MLRSVVALKEERNAKFYAKFISTHSSVYIMLINDILQMIEIVW